METPVKETTKQTIERLLRSGKTVESLKKEGYHAPTVYSLNKMISEEGSKPHKKAVFKSGWAIRKEVKALIAKGKKDDYILRAIKVKPDTVDRIRKEMSEVDLDQPQVNTRESILSLSSKGMKTHDISKATGASLAEVKQALKGSRDSPFSKKPFQIIVNGTPVTFEGSLKSIFISSDGIKVDL